MLTVEYNIKGFVEVYMDDEGRDLLVNKLLRLKAEKGRGDHNHLMTPSWSGYELSEDKQGEDNTLINQLNIRLLPY